MSEPVTFGGVTIWSDKGMSDWIAFQQRVRARLDDGANADRITESGDFQPWVWEILQEEHERGIRFAFARTARKIHEHAPDFARGDREP